MPTSFPKLLSPIQLRGHTLRNRVVFGAHTANMAEQGLPGERHRAYYAERALGGAAMVVVEPMPVHSSTVLTRGNFRHGDDSVIPAFRGVVEAIKSHGAVAIQQLYHIGSHGDSDNSFHPHWSPSGQPSYHDSDGSHAMSEAEIWETIDGFVQAARVAAERGHCVVLAEASNRLGGQFRLAGLQPRRAQILDLMDWYERQLARAGVEVRLNTPMDAEDIGREGADAVILALGAAPNAAVFQKALPHLDALPGLDRGGVMSVEAVMARQARPGSRVLLLDEAGGWRGCGTAWKLALDGHSVTLVTPDPMVGKELQRTAADAPLRKTLGALGVRFVVETSLTEWRGSGARLRSHVTGDETFIEADALVYATTPMASTELPDSLRAAGLAFQEIGDGVAPRQAPYAFYEGRKVAREI